VISPCVFLLFVFLFEVLGFGLTIPFIQSIPRPCIIMDGTSSFRRSCCSPCSLDFWKRGYIMLPLLNLFDRSGLVGLLQKIKRRMKQRLRFFIQYVVLGQATMGGAVLSST
jgi:hypothetical protein